MTISRSTLPDDFASSFTDLTAPFGQVSVNSSATGNLEVPGDRDWFRVSADRRRRRDDGVERIAFGVGDVE